MNECNIILTVWVEQWVDNLFNSYTVYKLLRLEIPAGNITSFLQGPQAAYLFITRAPCGCYGIVDSYVTSLLCCISKDISDVECDSVYINKCLH